MCSYIVCTAPIEGSAKGKTWFPLKQANVIYDHPVHAFMEHALIIDFVNYDIDIGARVSVEMTAESARELIKTIQQALETADALQLQGKVPAVATAR